MGGNKGKKRKSYYVDHTKNGKRPRRDNDFCAGLKGFLFTYNGAKPQPLIIEAYRILNHYAAKLYGEEKIQLVEHSDGNGVSKEKDYDYQSGSDEEDIEASLKKEVEDIKTNSRSTNRRFQAVKTKAGGCVFIKTLLEDPNELVNSIFESVEAKEYTNINMMQRMLPVTATCYASVEKILECAEKLIETSFHGVAQTSLKFCCVWKVRCNKTLSRDDVVLPICKMVNQTGVDHVTDYSEPQIVIGIEVIANACAICILNNWTRFKKYNLQNVAGFNLNQKTNEPDWDAGDAANPRKANVWFQDEEAKNETDSAGTNLDNGKEEKLKICIDVENKGKEIISTAETGNSIILKKGIKNDKTTKQDRLSEHTVFGNMKEVSNAADQLTKSEQIVN